MLEAQTSFETLDKFCVYILFRPVGIRFVLRVFKMRLVGAYGETNQH